MIYNPFNFGNTGSNNDVDIIEKSVFTPEGKYEEPEYEIHGAEQSYKTERLGQLELDEYRYSHNTLTIQFYLIPFFNDRIHRENR
jgi:hypothetical protein